MRLIPKSPGINSLAFRLIAGATLWSAAVLVAGGVILSSLFRSAVEDRFDAQLEALLGSLVATVDTEPGQPPTLIRPLGEPRFAEPYSGWYWQIEPIEGDLLRSPSLFDAALQVERGVEPNSHGYASGPLEQKLRVVAQYILLPGEERPHRFLVAADLAEVEQEIARFNTALYWSLGVLGAGLIAAMVIQVRFGLQPLRRLRRALAAIRHGEADQLKGTYPAEIMPLADELNALIAHNAAVVERARTHVGNLAHALKTPLSVLTNEGATAAGVLAETVRRQSALMRRLVDHYLTRARTAARANVLGARTPVEPVIGDLQRTLQRIHAERDLTIESACAEDLVFRGERQDLEEMVGNLLDNACKWARSRVQVDAGEHNGQVVLRIDDDGPGLADDERENVMRRGIRLDESVPGSGLGLAIVRDIAALYGGNVTLERAKLGGLRAVLTLPAAPSGAG